jgi:hypothetical protein
VITLLCLAPLFVWNAQHDNLNWIHTLNRGNRSTDAAPGRWLGEFWGGQGLVVGPFLLIAELIALYHALRRPSEPRNAFVIAFTVPILAVCTIIAIRSKVEINWCVAAHLTGLLAVAGLWFGQARSLPPAPSLIGMREGEPEGASGIVAPPGFSSPSLIPMREGAGGRERTGFTILRTITVLVSAVLSVVLFFPNAW